MSVVTSWKHLCRWVSSFVSLHCGVFQCAVVGLGASAFLTPGSSKCASEESGKGDRDPPMPVRGHTNLRRGPNVSEAPGVQANEAACFGLTTLQEAQVKDGL